MNSHHSRAGWAAGQHWSMSARPKDRGATTAGFSDEFCTPAAVLRVRPPGGRRPAFASRRTGSSRPSIVRPGTPAPNSGLGSCGSAWSPRQASRPPSKSGENLDHSIPGDADRPGCARTGSRHVCAPAPCTPRPPDIGDPFGFAAEGPVHPWDTQLTEAAEAMAQVMSREPELLPAREVRRMVSSANKFDRVCYLLGRVGVSRRTSKIAPASLFSDVLCADAARAHVATGTTTSRAVHSISSLEGKDLCDRRWMRRRDRTTEFVEVLMKHTHVLRK